jgi:hypothetical protein
MKEQTREIYTRNEESPNFFSNILEISDEISFVILQIENILFTKKNEVLGNHEFGIDLEEMIFSLNLNEIIIKNKIIDAILDYCPEAEKYNVEVDVTFYQTDSIDVAIIDIIIDGRIVLSNII